MFLHLYVIFFTISEAEYASERGIPILPIQLQPKYKPDGWLGILCGSMYRYNLCNQTRYESEVKLLLSKVREISAGNSQQPTLSTVPKLALDMPGRLMHNYAGKKIILLLIMVRSAKLEPGLINS